MCDNSEKASAKCGDCADRSAAVETLSQPMLIVNELNSIYEGRLADIEAEAQGDLELKTINYKEWVDMLTSLIHDLLESMQELEAEATKRIDLLERKLQTDRVADLKSSQQEDLRHDFDNLIALVQRAVATQEWNDEGLEFRTVAREDIFGRFLKDAKCDQNEDLAAENERLKQRIADMEKQQTQNTPCSYADLSKSTKSSSGISSARMTSSRASSPDSCSTAVHQDDFFAQDSDLESTKMRYMAFEESCYLKTLNSELEQLCLLQSAHNRSHEEQNKLLADQQNKVKEVVARILRELKETHGKLDYLREQLVDIDAHAPTCVQQVDSGYTTASEQEQDCKVLCLVRDRIRGLLEDNLKLVTKVQGLELEVQEGGIKLRNKCEIIENNDKILREVTATLESACGKQISYEAFVPETFFREKCAKHPANPLCEAITCLDRSGKAEICRLQSSLQEARLAIESNEEDLGIAEAELQDKNRVICELRSQLTAYEEKLRDLESKANSQCSDACQYQREIAEYNNYIRQIESKSRFLAKNVEEEKSKNEDLEQEYENVNCAEAHAHAHTHHLDCADIIDELTHDLASLSTEVTVAGRELERVEVGEALHAAFAEQNELLRATVERLLQEGRQREEQNRELEQQVACLNQCLQRKDQACSRLCCEKDNLEKEMCRLRESCRCELTDQRIGILQREVQERDEQIENLRSKVRDLNCSLSDKSRELQMTRCKLSNGADLALSQKRLTDCQKQLADKTKMVQDASHRIGQMERLLQSTQNQCGVVNSENALLKEEIFALKEGQACFAGVERSLKEQLHRAEDELALARSSFLKMSAVTDENEKVRENCRRLKDGNFELVRKYNDLIEDYNKLEDEYSKLTDIITHLRQEVDALNCWKVEQTQQDELWKQKVHMMEGHICTLTRNREELVDKVNELNRDNQIIRCELDFFKSSYTDLCPTASQISTSVNNLSADVVNKLIQNIRQSLRTSQSRWARDADKDCA